MAFVSSVDGIERLWLLDVAIEQAYNAIIITDADLENGPRIIYVNAAFERITGFGAEEVFGKTPRILQGERTPRDFLQRLRAALEAGHSFDGETVNYRKDGVPYDVQLFISPVFGDGDGNAAKYYISVQVDVTEQRHRDEKLRLLSTALEVSADPVLITNPDAAITYVNAAFEEQTGYARDEVLGQNPRMFGSGQQDAAFYQDLWETLERGKAFRGEFINRRRDGSLLHLEQTINPVTDAGGRVTHYVAIGKDVTERVRMEDEIRRLAHTDWLTGLANRLSIGDTLEAEVERSRRYGRPLALIMFDIDHFKAFNDDYGHETGDEVLKQLARTVRGVLREADAPGRWGGEEFVVVVPETSGEGARAMAEKLREAVAGMEIPCPGSVTASFGVTEMQTGDTPKTLARRVDEAMYQAKEAGRNGVVLL